MTEAEEGRIAVESDDFAELVRRVARDRDREAFARLFDHFAPRLEGYLARLGTDRAQAEEVVQEVMVVLWRKAELYDPSRSSLATWLFRIARNRRIDLLRRARTSSLDAEDPSLWPSAPVDAPDVIDSGRREAAVRRAMRGLPPEQVELVGLAFFLGLSHSQIADRTGLPLGTVKSRIRLAFSRLRKLLEEDGFTAEDH